MRVLVTGAGGHIGWAVVPELLRSGHAVVGLARSEASAAAVAALGADVRRGDVTDLPALRDAAATVDAVVHLAFDHDAVHAGDLTGAAEGDLAVVTALGDALAGTGKALVGIGTADDDVDAAQAAHPRRPVADAVAGLAGHDVRSILVGVPQVVHSERDRIGFVPTLIGIARATGVSGYVDDGATRWPAVHALDLGRLFRLALEQAPAGAQLPGAAEEGVRVREIAEVIGRHLDLPTRSVPATAAVGHFGPFGMFMGFDNPMPSRVSRTTLGWEPRHPGLVADLDEGRYFSV